MSKYKYKVIGDFPDGSFYLGEIIETNEDRFYVGEECFGYKYYPAIFLDLNQEQHQIKTQHGWLTYTTVGGKIISVDPT